MKEVWLETLLKFDFSVTEVITCMENMEFR